jgi:hypothetical protein
MTTMNENRIELPDDDWIERALRSEARAHADGYITDDGFTARVMADLPPPTALPAWRKRAVATMWTIAAAGIAVAFPETFADVAREALRFAAQPVSLSQMGAGVLALGAAMWAGAAILMKQD